MDHTKALTHISLCAGYGGIDLGLRRALGAVRTITYVEIEAFPLANLVKKIEQGLLDPCPLYTDLKTLPWELYRGKVDILSGGFPCQPFSLAGRRAGDEDPRHLWPHIVRGIKRLGRPSVIFFENVEGILRSELNGEHWSDPAGTPVLLHIHREMERLGYEATSGLFSASEVGAPHQRKRVFILGVRSDLKPTGRRVVADLLRRTRDDALADTDRAGDPASRCEDQQQGAQGVEGWHKHTQPEPSRYHQSYPAFRGRAQLAFEPPRVTEPIESIYMENADGERLEGQRVKLQRPAERCDDAGDNGEGGYEPSERGMAQSPAQPSMGGDVDGFADRLGLSELFRSCVSRTDEIRMLGNGVVPATAERAFRVLFGRLSGLADTDGDESQ